VQINLVFFFTYNGYIYYSEATNKYRKQIETELIKITTQTIMKSNFPIQSIIAKATCFFITAVATANVSLAQTPVSTPAELKTACETSPGNIVNINQSAKISMPAVQFSPVLVNCGCTVVVSNEATFEFEQANVKFAGAFTVQSTGKSTFKATKSLISAVNTTINLGGTGSDFAMSQSSLDAGSGNMLITVGPQAKFELYGYFNSQSYNGLSAAGVVNISAGANFTGFAADGGIRGLQGIQFNISGEEGLLTIEKTALRALNGNTGIIMPGDKSKLTLIESFVFSKGETTIELAGEEANIKMEEGGFGGPAYNIRSTGSVSVVAGKGSKNKGNIEMVAIQSGNPAGGFSVVASAGGTDGKVSVGKSSISGVGGAILFATGTKGSTEVKENNISSLTSITISAGADGSCVSAPNRALTAPVVSACTVPAAARQQSIPAATEAAAGSYSIFPNPGRNGSTQVIFNNGSEAKDISVTDMLGRQVKSWSNYRNATLAISQLKKGYYTLKVSNNKNGKVESRAFIIAE
jgi:Secretion system C-terminal sorting domain